MNDRLIRRRAAWGALALGAAGLLFGITGIPATSGEAKAGYTRVYEPQTSLPLAATVCWQAGTEASRVCPGRDPSGFRTGLSGCVIARAHGK